LFAKNQNKMFEFVKVLDTVYYYYYYCRTVTNTTTTVSFQSGLCSVEVVGYAESPKENCWRIFTAGCHS